MIYHVVWFFQVYSHLIHLYLVIYIYIYIYVFLVLFPYQLLLSVL